MTYVPTKIIIQENMRLVESDDLTKSLIQYTLKPSYLLVTRNNFNYVISLSQILTFLPKINLSQRLIDFISPLLNDEFIERFSADYIPIKNNKGFYNKCLKVFNPLSYKDYQVSFTSINTPEIIDDETQRGFLDDLVVTGDENLSNSLVSVNGVFHRTSFINNKLYVHDGFRTFRVSQKKDIALIDTSDLGGHQTVPITQSMINQSDWQKPAILTSPVSFNNKTIFLVIDGYFYHLSTKIYKQISDNKLIIYTNKLRLINQWKHNPRTLQYKDLLADSASQTSRKYTDNYQSFLLNQRYVSSDALKTAAFQYSRLTHYHSFLVLINNPYIYQVSRDLLPTGTPRFYHDPASQGISGMLRYGCGLCPSYLIWKDVFARKSIFLSEVDNDTDYEHQSYNPNFIPNLIERPQEAAKQVSASLIDYFCA